MKKILKRIGWTILVLLVVAGIGLTGFVGYMVAYNVTHVSSREETLENVSKYSQGYQDFAKKHTVEEISFPSSEFDHQIPAILVEEEGNQNLAVLVHGMGGTKESLSQVADVFLDLGFNILAYDQRNSGENMADNESFGVWESYDALDAVAYAKDHMDQVGQSGKLLLFGESYGGATALIASSRDDSNIDYLVLDCPVANGYELVEPNLKEVEEKEGAPVDYTKFAGDVYMKLTLGFTLDDINSAEYIKDKALKAPVLIMNSKADDVTPYHMGKEIYDAIEGDRKVLHTEESYGHTKFVLEAPDQYKEVIDDFLKKFS